MLWYKAVKEYANTWENGCYVTYGLVVYRIDFCGIRRCFYVSDVSLDRGLVRRLARDCTKGQLSLVHIYDVIIDRLS